MDVLSIIAQQGFQDHEYQAPKKVLEDAGFKVVTASITSEPCIGSLGSSVIPDIRLKDARIEQYDMVIMAGGPGAPLLFEHVKQLFLKAMQLNKPYGAICISPMVLARIGVLKGRRATVYKTEESLLALEQGGAEYTGNPVEVDGNVITANGPAAAESFGEAIVKLLNSIS